jgi:hypothetical protein
MVMVAERRPHSGRGGGYGRRAQGADTSTSDPVCPVLSHDASFLGLLQAYISGKRTFRFRHGGDARRIERVQEQVDALCGLKVVGEDSGFLVVKDGLAEADLDPRGAVRRMHLTTRKMVEEATSALAGGTPMFEGDIRCSRSRVERLAWLVNRQSNILASDGALAARLCIPPRRALGYLKVAASLENAAAAASELVKRGNHPLHQAHRAGIRRLGAEAANHLDSAFFGAFLAQNLTHADRVAGALGSTRAGLWALAGGAENGGRGISAESPGLPAIVEGLDRICVSAEEIAMAMHIA